MELEILLWMQQNLRSPWMDQLMVFTTKLGDMGIVWMVIAVVLCCSIKTRRNGVLLLLAIVFAGSLGVGVLKNVFMRPRPCSICPIDLLIPKPSDYSFPSGHTLVSFCSARTLAETNEKWRVPAYVLASLIGFSRMYLFVHYPTDILGGIFFGIVIAEFVLLLCEGDESVFSKFAHRMHVPERK